MFLREPGITHVRQPKPVIHYTSSLICVWFVSITTLCTALRVMMVLAPKRLAATQLWSSQDLHCARG